MATLYVLCGIPGSGKSHFCKNHKADAVHVSRDAIRFALLENDDDYFAHEDEVCEIFWEKINKELAAGHDVYADQTSLSFKPRHWLLSHIKIPCKKVAVYIDTPFEVCVKRNNKRVGRERVPVYIMKNMLKSMTIPTLEEGFDDIIIYNGGDEI